MSADTSEFTVSEGEEISLTFSAQASQGLNVEWANGRVVLTPSDSSIPVQTLPITVNFIAGVAPEKTGVIAKRTSDSVPVSGVMTIGTNDLQISKSGIAKADIYDLELMRDATNGTIYHWDNPEDKAMFAIPLNIQADSKRLVIEVLETTSPDIDLYVGIDSNLDGKPDSYEMQLMPYMSATETAFEVIDEISPLNDTYWVIVHNWAEGPAELTKNQMICAEGQEADEGMECAEAPIMDSVKLAITNVAHDDDSLTVTAPISADPLEEIAIRLAWNQEMSAGDIYHGVFWLGTSAELNKNIGSVKVNMRRGEDDVQVSTPSVNGDKLTFAVNVANNNSGEERVYDFSVELAEGVNVDLLFSDISAAVTNMAMSASDIEYSFEGNVLTWQHTQAVDAPSVAFSLVLDTASVVGMVDATPVIESKVGSSDEIETSVTESIFIEGRPTFSASASMTQVKEGEPVTLTATIIDAVIENPELSYLWTQTSGPSVSFSGTGSSITFDAPKVSYDQTLTFSLVGSNGSKTSATEGVSVNIENKSSGGGTGLGFLILTSLGLLSRRK
jgi:hypothetical protein